MPEILVQIAEDPRVVTVFALIALDVIMGIAEALKKKQFEWGKVSEFYVTMIVPMMIGYAAISVLVPLMTADLLGELSDEVSTVLVTGAWVALVTKLVASALGHFAMIFPQVAQTIKSLPARIL